MSQSYVAPRQVLLAAASAKGLEITGTFARRGGQVMMELQVTNRALQPVSGMTMQLNKNTFALTPGAPLEVRDPLPPN